MARHDKPIVPLSRYLPKHPNEHSATSSFGFDAPARWRGVAWGLGASAVGFVLTCLLEAACVAVSPESRGSFYVVFGVVTSALLTLVARRAGRAGAISCLTSLGGLSIPVLGLCNKGDRLWEYSFRWFGFLPEWLLLGSPLVVALAFAVAAAVAWRVASPRLDSVLHVVHLLALGALTVAVGVGLSRIRRPESGHLPSLAARRGEA